MHSKDRVLYASLIELINAVLVKVMEPSRVSLVFGTPDSIFREVMVSVGDFNERELSFCYCCSCCLSLMCRFM